MLPIIDLPLADYVTIAFNYCLGLYLPIGRSLWFDRGVVAKAGKELHLNFDDYLTALLFSCFSRESEEAQILTFYAAIPGRFALSICTLARLPGLNPQTCLALPGCIDLRQDFIPQTAAPFLLSEGGSLSRLHPVSHPDRTSFYLWDFGDCLGNFLKEVDKAFYFRILNDKQTYFGYSVVPKNPCTSITYRGGVIPVHHALCQIT